MICTILSMVNTSVSGVTLPITPRSVARVSVATPISSVKQRATTSWFWNCLAVPPQTGSFSCLLAGLPKTV
jgi:hypothetical protein